jgi:hypothetical protein
MELQQGPEFLRRIEREAERGITDFEMKHIHVVRPLRSDWLHPGPRGKAQGESSPQVLGNLERRPTALAERVVTWTGLTLIEHCRIKSLGGPLPKL